MCSDTTAELLALRTCETYGLRSIRSNAVPNVLNELDALGNG